MNIRAMKKMIFACALCAAMTGLSSCTDLSYEEFEDESAVGKPDAALSQAALNDQQSDSAADDKQQDQSSSAETSETDFSSISSLFPPLSSNPDISEPDSSEDEPEDIEYTPQYLNYKEILSEYRERFLDTDPDLGSEYCRYYIADIDADGTYELICETGTFQADRRADVFTFDGERPKLLGDFTTWRAELLEGNGGVYSDNLAMGVSTLYQLKIIGGNVTTESTQSSMNSSDLRKLRYYGYDDDSGLDILLETPPAQWFDIYS